MSKNLLRTHLLEMLDGTSVHCGIKEALSDIPYEYWGRQRKNLPYTLYTLLEHIRLSNRDILEYLSNPDYCAGAWPEEYWSMRKKPKDHHDLETKVKAVLADLETVRKLIQKSPLIEPLPYGDKKHTLAREVMILFSHTAYHTGQIIVLRRLLGIWSDYSPKKMN